MEIAAEPADLTLDLGEQLDIGKRPANGTRLGTIKRKPPKIPADAQAMRRGVALDSGKLILGDTRIDTRMPLPSLAVLGEALARHAMSSPDFKLMLKQVLQSAELRETDRAFLAGKGWL